MRRTDVWAYDLGIWPWRSPRLSVIRVLVGLLCQSTNCKFLWYYDFSFSIYGPLGQHGSDWSRDLTTLTFDLGGHGACGWCGSSSSIRVPSFKFVCLAIWKIWRTTYVSINGPGDPDLWPFDPVTGMRVASKVGNLPYKFGHDRTIGFSNYSLCTRPTDRRTDKSNAYCPIPFGGGGISNCSEFSHLYNILFCLAVFSASVCLSVLSVFSSLCGLVLPPWSTLVHQKGGSDNKAYLCSVVLH